MSFNLMIHSRNSKFVHDQILTPTKIISILFVVLFVLIGCASSDEPDSQTIGSRSNAGGSSATNLCPTIDHDLGTTEVCGVPQTIVALGPNMLELLLALDVQAAGYSDYFSLPFTIFDKPDQQIPYLGSRVTNQPVNLGLSVSPSIEEITQLRPDLILGGVEDNRDEYNLLSQIAPTLLYRYPVTEEWKQQLRQVARALDRSEQAEQTISSYDTQFQQTRRQFRSLTETYPKVLLLGSEQLEEGIQIDPYNHASRCSSLVTELGFSVVVPQGVQQPAHGSTVSIELLPTLEADWIVIQGWNSDFQELGGDPDEYQVAAIEQQWYSNAIALTLEPNRHGRVLFTSAYLCRALPGPIGTNFFLEWLESSMIDDAGSVSLN